MPRGTLEDGNLFVPKPLTGGRSPAQMNMKRSSKSERRSQVHRQASVKESLTKVLDEGLAEDLQDEHSSPDNPIMDPKKSTRNDDNISKRRHSVDAIRSRRNRKDEGLGDNKSDENAYLDHQITGSKRSAGKRFHSTKSRHIPGASPSHRSGTNQANDQSRRRSADQSKTLTSSGRSVNRSQSVGNRISSRPGIASNHKLSSQADISAREKKYSKDGSKNHSDYTKTINQQEKKSRLRSTPPGLSRGNSGRTRRISETPPSPSTLGTSPRIRRAHSVKSRNHHHHLTHLNSPRRRRPSEEQPSTTGHDRSPKPPGTPRRQGIRRAQSEQTVSKSLPEISGISAGTSGSLDSHLAGQESNGSRRRLFEENISFSSGLSNMANSGGRGSLGLDAGPLNGFLHNHNSLRTARSISFGGEDTNQLDKSLVREKQRFMEQRKSRQDEILKLAQSTHFDYSYEDESNHHTVTGIKQVDGRIPDGEHDDQPTPKGKKKSPLARLRSGLAKTGKVTKSTAKGTVNVVRDPKRAAKKVGGFAKDVGTETVHMAMNPILAAKKAANLGKDVTKGTLMVTKGVGKGVAMGGIGLTKGVAKVGVGATTMVLETALDGAGKVLSGANGLIFKHGQDEDEEDEFSEYKASELESRKVNILSLVDRVANVADFDSPEKPASGLPKAADTNATIEKRNLSTSRTGLMVPVLNLKSGTKGWDY